ncbi:DUF2235 domain-containing protein [Pseudacidovorax sp. RU35E]|uniref:T6SS phospholipase effector Tle1-like catalytic domain-containing protein n=1 Tax=Pseudacidovorax sp. RU35E TaxID=1907403 RepID=UPI0009560FA8|nr:DUF2235 domain-containing protein [Pseudacidovorax sp. RU35E]SIR68131.1 Uncharacterized alpha/beta hydrolase domain [Pseudacidovorax sp. RU35E]
MSTYKSILDPATMRYAKPLAFPQAAFCEQIINIGLFFDGTDNNHSFHPSALDTNVWKLSLAYRNEPVNGFYRYYISGVGTPFTEIGQKVADAMGGPFGAGGEARIVYGLLQVFNAVHQTVNGQEARFEAPSLAALCSENRTPDTSASDTSVPPPRLTPEQKILDQLGLPCGLVGASDRSFLGASIAGERRKFFSRVSGELRQQIAQRDTRPRPKAIYLDVFGFSRGAAQARVFVSWLHQYLMVGGELFGVPAYVRMLGIFDTVASVGVTDALGSDGHNAWATAEDLRIHPGVRNCLHHVALHELRMNFPSDSVAQGDGLPTNCEEHHCPGVHSDIGGGYAAGEQGKGIRIKKVRGQFGDFLDEPELADDLRLSNLTLKHMYDAAVQACEGHIFVPWIALDSPAAERLMLPSEFGLVGHDLVRKAVERYFTACGVPAGLDTREALRQHGQRYLAWRYAVTLRPGFEKLPSVDRSSRFDPQGKEFYLLGQQIFKQQIDLLDRPPGPIDMMGNREVMRNFHSKALDIYKDIKKIPVPYELGEFFDDWVHDSYAGFIGKFREAGVNWVKTTKGNLVHIMAEGQRYMRWRQIYQGSNLGLNAQLQRAAQEGALA